MDKSKLLEEFFKLKCLLKDHENKQTTVTSNVKFNGNNALKNSVGRQGNQSKLFLNPNKLNTVQNETLLKIPGKVLSTNMSKSSAKVFINPNFRTPDSSQVCSKPLSNQDKKQKQIRGHIHKSKIFISNHVDSGLQKLPSDPILTNRQKTSTHYSHGISKSPVVEKKSLTSNSRMIFVNPEFSSSSKLDSCIFNSCSTSMRIKNITGSTNNQKRKGRENINGIVKKIFINPEFERKELDSKKCLMSHTEVKVSDEKMNRKFTNTQQDSHATQTSAIKDSAMIPVLLSGEKAPNKFTSISYPISGVIVPECSTEVGKKTTIQRLRGCSTSLVTVSKTKLVRKRKFSQTNGKVVSQPMFVSKTRLVRNVSRIARNTSCIAKVKVKQYNQTSQVQLASAEKLKLRGKSSIDSSTTIVTKIKSNNGKSLKLIHKSAFTPITPTVAENMQTQNMMNNKKMELRQRASRITMCLIQSRLKRNQFSKINVPIKVTQLQSYNKNVYKKNNVMSKKPLTKAALVGKKETTNVLVAKKPLTKAALVGKKETTNVLAKSQIRTPLDMTEFTKSKYRLIRKRSSNVINRYRLCKKIMTKYSPPNKLVQHKKLKWKRKVDMSKRRLTRKDLSIKKIGGVFYRYSRTTLAKNKPSFKQVSQPHSMGLNKSTRRKRANASGMSVFTSPTGMSWRRMSHSSARSILTQAKLKSIHLLSKKMRKNNEPCLFFHRYGRCSGHERGTCVRLHDNKYVAVCKKFVQGSCTDTHCCLSHSPSCHNMPTCHHFLAGQCGRDRCPYPHIKVSDCAPVCLDFLKGYCILGDQCAKRHFEICPSFEKGVCARGKYCPYPHPKNKVGENMQGKFKHIKRKTQLPKEAEPVSTPNLRYFEDINLQKENQIHLSEEREGTEDCESEVEEITCLKKRPQLGELPSYIPLSHSFLVQDT